VDENQSRPPESTDPPEPSGEAESLLPDLPEPDVEDTVPPESAAPVEAATQVGEPTAAEQTAAEPVEAEPVEAEPVEAEPSSAEQPVAAEVTDQAEVAESETPTVTEEPLPALPKLATVSKPSLVVRRAVVDAPLQQEILIDHILKHGLRETIGLQRHRIRTRDLLDDLRGA